MKIIFYLSAIVAILSTIMVVTRKEAVHAFLYLVVSLFSISVIFFISGAPFVAALEVIVYAGAIMILFLFAIMMLNLGKDSVQRESQLMTPRVLDISCYPMYCTIGRIDFCLSKRAISRRRNYKNDRCSRSVKFPLSEDTFWRLNLQECC
jgi:energy-coupling factor transporter transmembrane protein EcfT